MVDKLIEYDTDDDNLENIAKRRRAITRLTQSGVKVIKKNNNLYESLDDEALPFPEEIDITAEIARAENESIAKAIEDEVTLTQVKQVYTNLRDHQGTAAERLNRVETVLAHLIKLTYKPEET